MRARLPRRWRPQSRAKTALWIVLLIGALTSVTVGSVWAAYSSQEGNDNATVATGALTMTDTANYASTTASSSSAITTTNGTSLIVASASGFPNAGSYTIKIDNEEMLVTAGQGTTTWTVTRGVNGTTAATHSVGATVSTAPCKSWGSGSSGNINTTCDAALGYSAGTENYPGNPVTPTFQLTASGSLDFSDLEAWMPSCLRGVTGDASWAANTASITSFTGASSTLGNLVQGVTYYYEITAVVGGVEQVAGAEASYTVPNTGTSTNQITLNWSSVAGATAYKVYRSTVEGDEQLLNAPGNVTTLADTFAATTQLGFPPTGQGSGDPCFTPHTTFLNGAINNSTTTINVSSFSGFPLSGTFTILVDGEQMTVTGGQGTTTWTVTRGANSSTAASHNDQEPVELLDRATTLTGTITNSQTSITVSSAAGFPTDPHGTFRILVYDTDGSNVEEMTVTGGQGTTTWTVTRGVGGTSATAKTTSNPVVLLLDDVGFYLEETNSDASAKKCFYPAVSTLLNGAINNSQTSIAVSSAANFPASGNYGIIVDGEQMTVTGGQGTTTWTVTRGAHSSTAVAHNNLATVYASSCSFDPTSDLGYFAGNFNALLQAIDFGAGPTSLGTRYFTTGFQLPSYSSNAMQGTEALFTVRWHAQS